MAITVQRDTVGTVELAVVAVRVAAVPVADVVVARLAAAALESEDSNRDTSEHDDSYPHRSTIGRAWPATATPHMDCCGHCRRIRPGWLRRQRGDTEARRIAAAAASGA